MKRELFISIMFVLALIFAIFTGSYAFFTSQGTSQESAVAATSMKYDLGVKVESLFEKVPLVPANDEDIYIAYNNECVDDFGYGACHAYKIIVSGDGLDLSLIGTINFDVEHIENLNYMVFSGDEVVSSNVYVDKTIVTDDTDLSMGNEFYLESGNETEFILVIWLSNLDVDQKEVDSAGTYTASLSYSASNGSIITGVISS